MGPEGVMLLLVSEMERNLEVSLPSVESVPLTDEDGRIESDLKREAGTIACPTLWRTMCAKPTDPNREVSKRDRTSDVK